ncbi:MAG: T9SS type A sorting domain-containing protein, partial [Bacteroidales bacterium]|nr:T9SS type A sorting domain-containing protein [Bacteroidales bacterium]
EFVNWTDLDGTIVSTDPLYKFIVGDNLILFANFEVKTFQITVLPNPPDGGTVSGGGIYDCRETVIVKAFPEPCYTFVNWTLNGVVVSWDAFYAFDVEESCTLIANFELSYFDVTVEADQPTPNGGQVFVEIPATNIPCKASKTVHAFPDDGYHFINWTVDGDEVSTNASYTFIVEKSTHLVAHFEKDTYDIILLANPPDGATMLIGAGTYEAGDNITVEAIAHPCYNFVDWTENGNTVWLNPQYPFTVTKSRTLVANFEIILYDVALSVDSPNTGEVTGDGTGLPCGDSITITAIPDECYTFVEWTENGNFVSNENPYTFVLEEDRDIVAHFTIRYCNITVSVDPEVGDNDATGGATGILCGETITVTAIADTCFTFLYWTEDGVIVSYDAEYTFVVLEDRDLVANFAQKTFAITLLRNPPAGGDVEGGGNQLCGEIITVTAIPDDCFTFINWTEDGVPVCYTTDYEFLVTEPRTLVANFEQKTFNVTVFANPPTGGTALQNYTDAPCGDPVIVIAIPAEGYQFDNWTENGVPVSNLDHYSFDIKSSRVLVANFTIQSFDITVIADPPIGGTVTGGGFYDNNEEATVKATPNPHYMFINWTENGMPVSPDSIYTFTVTQSRTLVAHFDSIFYTVITDVNDPNYGFTEGDGVYGEDESVTVVATTTSCYRFAHWTIDDDIVSLDPIYTFTVTKDVTVVANFYALDFDTYAPTLWNNTFMLNLRKLAEEHYIVTGCIWYKNGNIEPTTRTIDEFSYSAGPAITDLLELAPTWYMFELLTSSHGPLCSTHKALDYNPLSNPPSGDLVIYPNPVISGNTFTVEGVVEGCTVQVFNQYGMCVRSVIATKNPITLTLSNVQPGTYVIQANGKEGKVVVIP